MDPKREAWPESTVRTAVSQTGLARPALRASPASLRSHFSAAVDRVRPPLENPHLESRVTEQDRSAATASAVLIAIVDRGGEPTVLVTTRHHAISFPGHIVFPGGRSDAGDATPVETALREAEEEIGLDRARVEVLGCLGDYVTHSGFRISPIVALVEPPLGLVPQAGEVAEIHEFPLRRMLDSRSYVLMRFESRAYFSLEHEGLRLTGATVSLCIGLYSELLETHEAL